MYFSSKSPREIPTGGSWRGELIAEGGMRGASENENENDNDNGNENRNENRKDS